MEICNIKHSGHVCELALCHGFLKCSKDTWERSRTYLVRVIDHLQGNSDIIIMVLRAVGKWHYFTYGNRKSKKKSQAASCMDLNESPKGVWASQGRLVGHSILRDLLESQFFEVLRSGFKKISKSRNFGNPNRAWRGIFARLLNR